MNGSEFERENIVTDALSTAPDSKPATALEEQVPEPVKDERLQTLQLLLREQQERFNRAMIGRTLPVLFVPTTVNANPGEQVTCSGIVVTAGVFTTNCNGNLQGDPIANANANRGSSSTAFRRAVTPSRAPFLRVSFRPWL